MYTTFLNVLLLGLNLKELYTSISTLAQKLVLTLLNNEFILEKNNFDPVRTKNPQTFSAKKP